VQIAGKAAEIVANAVYCVRRVEVRYDKGGTPYIYLTNEDLKLLDLT